MKSSEHSSSYRSIRSAVQNMEMARLSEKTISDSPHGQSLSPYGARKMNTGRRLTAIQEDLVQEVGSNSSSSSECTESESSSGSGSSNSSRSSVCASCYKPDEIPLEEHNRRRKSLHQQLAQVSKFIPKSSSMEVREP